MFKKPVKETVEFLQKRALDFAVGSKTVYVSLSGGVDSAVVVTILARAFGKENVVAMFRDIRSNKQHEKDARELQKAVGFKLIVLDANPLYEMFLEKCQGQFVENGISWCEEGSVEASQTGWDGAYASLKSRFATPFAGFISKAIASGGGRVFGTGNIEEDLLLRYFDKFGDGAVDNHILAGLTKTEVRQVSLWFEKEFSAKIFGEIARKIPSADLQSNGDQHNDEDELELWAKNMGFKVKLSYGDLEKEGNIAWVVKQDLDFGVVTGKRARLDAESLAKELGYSEEQIQITLFVRRIEKGTRHKDLGIPGITRNELREKGLVD